MPGAIARAAEGLASLAGWVLAAVFFLVGTVRRTKALHPRGEVVRGVLRRHGAGTTGVAWLDESGVDDILVRRSQSVGLPEGKPDIIGLALRVPTEGQKEFGDLLLASTGTSRLGRFLLRPALRHGAAAYTSLFPYRTPSGPRLLAALPVDGDPSHLTLASATLGGRWVPFGTLRVFDANDDGHDAVVSFDPVQHVVPGLDGYGWATRLRRKSYAASRRADTNR